ncbi:MFS transporter [Leifsonia kafniensis]|uniref:MFS transporter n=2 Tax=Leifsonia kafniensis TaxID=475957 RepID=A0ABP7JYJ1_9MICO
MLPTGLLPEMSESLGVSESSVGLLVTWFAFTVVATSTTMAHLTRRMPRHGLVVAVLIVFAISNVMTAFAPTYGLVVVSRVLGGLAHGLFWSVVGAYAAHLVPKEQIGRAVSITVAGGTLAFVFGVPLATAAGHLIGWRMSFALLAVLMLIGAAVVWKFLPKVTHHAIRDTDTNVTATQTPRALRTKKAKDPTVSAVILICCITMVIMVGHYTFYTYIAPYLIDVLGVGTDGLAPLLFAFGIAGAVGLVLSGTVFGPRPQLGIMLAVIVSALGVSALAVFSANLPVAIAAFVLWGIAFGTFPPLLQTRMLHTASLRFRDTASAIYTTAFNAGIGGGALVGAIVLNVAGLEVLPFVYIGLLGVAFVMLVVSDIVIRRRALA